MFYAMILAAVSPAQGVCQKLGADYEEASKRLAMSVAEDRGDIAARRSTDIRAQASQTLELMLAHKCRPPAATPSAQPYISQALRCYLDRIKGMDDPNSGEPNSCDTSRWIRK